MSASARSRRKPSVVARVRPFWIIAAALAIACAVAGAWLVQAPWFRIARIAIDVPIGSPVDARTVRDAAAIVPGTNVWLLAPWRITRRVEAIPYVDTATLRRGQFPKPSVDLAITVRRPTACVVSATQTVTIDATARVLQRGCASASAARIESGRARIPAPGGTIGDPAIARLLADARILADADLAPRRLGRDRWGGLDAVDPSGVILHFGEDDDLAKKAALIAPVRAGIGAKRALRAIDVRSPATPTVEFR